eukprot:CAMPEP_0176122938 /NCGR_PEP_ID=MMETSP0120_2-20121206/61929_1 /TAXON_ID=160619 /ORGANISM="Kryptoperidinium foliaceum, Strain CCMP 1326" /LENGTH=130 /DNA_ID=CAMNT_0017457591 /DNA_START=1 /DNA_END=393 /DNA_ORIENTATION=+
MDGRFENSAPFESLDQRDDQQHHMAKAFPKMRTAMLPSDMAMGSEEDSLDGEGVVRSRSALLHVPVRQRTAMWTGGDELDVPSSDEELAGRSRSARMLLLSTLERGRARLAEQIRRVRIPRADRCRSQMP